MNDKKNEDGTTIVVNDDIDRIRKKVWGDRTPPVVERKSSGIGPDRTTEMSDYFNYAQYDRATRSHTFYKEMIGAMLNSLKARIGNKKCTILELGCGNGTLTEELILLKNAEIVSIDVDKNAIEFTSSRVKASNLKFVRADALKFRADNHVDIVIASWNYEHITNYKNGHELARSIVANLKKDGLYIEGAELIGTFQNEFERQKAFIDYHEEIIDRALKDGNADTAEIEYLAMISGITGISHHKRDRETHIKEMESDGLQLKRMEKFGPFTKIVGSAGVYFFEFVRADDVK
ncbi:class I SAM-dependent methyltransferase [Candidatus Woesearchaeota archaeon]|nr:class I SAM-dependent methyltransferase [Candidatus Woesearchaeota archaeon]